jgi:RNA polymerase sigma-70 factor (ECF subfamily)
MRIFRIQIVPDWIVKAVSKTVSPKVIARARAGDNEAISVIYLTYYEQIYRYILYRVKSREVAQDLMQEVFVRMIESLARYEDRGFPISAWLYRIAYARCVDYYRSVRHETENLTLDHILVANGDWEEEVFKWMEMARVREFITQLTAEQQQVIILRFYQDMTVDETAKALQRSVGSVKALQHRAVKALEVLMGVRTE